MRHIEPPLSDEVAWSLRTGERVLVSGVIYAARDAAHQRFLAALKEGKELPFEPRGQIIYYVGPAPAPPGSSRKLPGPTALTLR